MFGALPICLCHVLVYKGVIALNSNVAYSSRSFILSSYVHWIMIRVCTIDATPIGSWSESTLLACHIHSFGKGTWMKNQWCHKILTTIRIVHKCTFLIAFWVIFISIFIVSSQLSEIGCFFYIEASRWYILWLVHDVVNIWWVEDWFASHESYN
jgi:hypothetical protein